MRLPLSPGLPAGRRVTLGVRPEHVRLGSPGSDAGGIGFDAGVVSVEPTGIDTHIVCDAGGTPITVSVRERARPAPGDTLRLVLDRNHLHRFDADSGMTLRG